MKAPKDRLIIRPIANEDKVSDSGLIVEVAKDSPVIRADVVDAGLRDMIAVWYLRGSAIPVEDGLESLHVDAVLAYE